MTIKIAIKWRQISRKVNILLTNSISCLYLKPDGQKPHSQLFIENDDNAIEKASRYVELIPFIEENQTWDYAEEMPDCWTTDNEFLTLGFGDYEEHAVLLCNYFNYIDQKQMFR